MDAKIFYVRLTQQKLSSSCISFERRVMLYEFLKKLNASYDSYENVFTMKRKRITEEVSASKKRRIELKRVGGA